MGGDWISSGVSVVQFPLVSMKLHIWLQDSLGQISAFPAEVGVFGHNETDVYISQNNSFFHSLGAGLAEIHYSTG